MSGAGEREHASGAINDNDGRLWFDASALSYAAERAAYVVEIGMANLHGLVVNEPHALLQDPDHELPVALDFWTDAIYGEAKELRRLGKEWGTFVNLKRERKRDT